MKKTNIRKMMIAVLAAAMCATGVVIPTSAQVETCADHTHELTHVSHGSSNTSSGSGDVCYYIHYTQCLYRCDRCGNTYMGHHTDSISHDYEPYYEAHNIYMRCKTCGYINY